MNPKKMTFNAHRGLSEINRLQPGFKIGSGFFQQPMDTMLSSAVGTFPLIDDFIVGGVDEAEHERNIFEANRELLFPLSHREIWVKQAKC